MMHQNYNFLTCVLETVNFFPTLWQMHKAVIKKHDSPTLNNWYYNSSFSFFITLRSYDAQRR